MMNKLYKLGLLGLAVGLTSALTSLQLFGQAQQGFAPNVPLTYTTVMRDDRSLEPDRLDSDEYLTRGAHRSDGSTARITYQIAEDGRSVESRNVFDLSNARYVILDAALRSTTTTTLSDQAVNVRRNGRRGCAGPVVSNLLGYDVTLRTSTPPAPIPAVAKHGELREETLLAPALGCLVMETKLILTYHDGSERVVRSERVIDVKVGDPDAAFFNIPEDYVEMSPATRMTALGRGGNASTDDVIQNFEQVYDAKRVR